MDYAYKIMFAVGVLYTFISLIISGISGALHLGSHLGEVHGHIGGHGNAGGAHGDIAGHGHAAGHTGEVHGHHVDAGTHTGGIGETFLSWVSILVNPIVAVSFLTVSGGIGILGTEYFNRLAIETFFAAFVSGTVVSFLLYRFVAVPLYKSENTTNVSREDLVSTTAEVISPILENGFGTIKYIVNSIRYTAPAKHVDGKAVMQGKKVIIYKIENNIYYVTEMEEL